MELLELEPTSLRVRIRCSRGTYARVLAEEIGMALDTAGHLGGLRREASGAFVLAQAVTFARLSVIAAGDSDWTRVLRPQRGQERVPWRARDEVLAGLHEHLVDTRRALAHLPTASLTPEEVRRFRNSGKLGRPVGESPTLLLDAQLPLGVAVPGGSAVVLGLPDGGRSLETRRGPRRP
jgi:tRNA U55 pseudouridine synthase TruB